MCSPQTRDIPCIGIGPDELPYFDSQGLRLLPGDVPLKCEKEVVYSMSHTSSSVAQANAGLRYLADAKTVADAAEVGPRATIHSGGRI